jgi:hypothetical protein
MIADGLAKSVSSVQQRSQPFVTMVIVRAGVRSNGKRLGETMCWFASILLSSTRNLNDGGDSCPLVLNSQSKVTLWFSKLG